jgi:hypothetical protein|tara:strand:+ start:2847 stop:3614 length:768 start_codon:yes stop_codon:yes gene_type:complete
MANAVKTKGDTKVATLDMDMFEQDAGAGLNNLGTEDLALPFLKVLSKQSDELDEIDNAKAGDILNTVTNTLYKGKINVVPCAYQRRFIQWQPRGSGSGAPVGIYKPTDDMPETSRSSEDNKEYLTDGSGDYIEQTCQWYVKVIEEDGTASNALIAMKSTQLKKSRKWMSMIMSRQMTGKNGPFTPPMYSHVYTLTTIAEENSKGKWHGWEMSLDKQVGDINLYTSAKAFAESVDKGDVNVKHTQDGESQNENIPF